jgi:hypothetical protein
MPTHIDQETPSLEGPVGQIEKDGGKIMWRVKQNVLLLHRNLYPEKSPPLDSECTDQEIPLFSTSS